MTLRPLVLALSLALALPAGAVAAADPGKPAASKAKNAKAKAAAAPAAPAKAAAPPKETPAAVPAKETPAKDAPAKDAPAAATGAVTPDTVAAGIQAFYETHPAFQARFTQVVKKRGLKKGIERKGEVFLQKGDADKGKAGKMRWDYPSEEIFYFCDGETLWSFERRQSLATKLPVKDSQMYQATSYLLGQGDLARDFQLSLVDSPLPDAWALKLVPKKGTQVMRSLTLVVDKKTHAVKASVLEDPVGDTNTLQWRDVRYQPIDDKVFVWTPPAGVQVRTLGGSAP